LIFKELKYEFLILPQVISVTIGRQYSIPKERVNALELSKLRLPLEVQYSPFWGIPFHNYF
jgi:hypothetical protein